MPWEPYFPKDGGYVLKRICLPRLIQGESFSTTSDFDVSIVEQRGGEYE